MIAVIDCGTTYSRIYIVEKGRIIGQSAQKIGVRDVAVSGSKELLKQGLQTIFHDAVRNAGLTPADIQYAVASGMITSEIGLLEIPHAVAPVGLQELAQQVVITRDPTILPIETPIVFVRGIKNRPDHEANFAGIRSLDFMRGEEVQVMGILSESDLQLPAVIIVLSSHTKLIYVNDKGQITASLTSLSGQIFEAVQQTIIASHPSEAAHDTVPDMVYDSILAKAQESVTKAGLLRALLMPRFMKVLLDSTQAERSLFVQAAISAADIKMLDEVPTLGLTWPSSAVLVGQEERCRIYQTYIQQKFTHCTIRSITDPNAIARLTVAGALEVARHLPVAAFDSLPAGGAAGNTR